MASVGICLCADSLLKFDHLLNPAAKLCDVWMVVGTSFGEECYRGAVISHVHQAAYAVGLMLCLQLHVMFSEELRTGTRKSLGSVGWLRKGPMAC